MEPPPTRRQASPLQDAPRLYLYLTYTKRQPDARPQQRIFEDFEPGTQILTGPERKLPLTTCAPDWYRPSSRPRPAFIGGPRPGFAGPWSPAAPLFHYVILPLPA